MDIYKKLFTQSLTEASFDVPPAGAEEELPASDQDVWANQNEDLAGNEELMSQFDVEGMPGDVTKQYIEKIQSWSQTVDQASSQIQDIRRFASKNAGNESGQKIFSSIGNVTSKILTDLGTLQGSLNALEQEIEMTAHDKKNKE